MSVTLDPASLPSGVEAWVNFYVGKSWVRGADGPDVFDCYGLLRHWYRHQYNCELPAFPGLSHLDFLRTLNSHLPQWTTVARPFQGCAVIMGGSRRFHHVGVFVEIDGGLILHAADGKTIVAQTLPGLKASGMQRFLFLKFDGCTY